MAEVFGGQKFGKHKQILILILIQQKWVGIHLLSSTWFNGWLNGGKSAPQIYCFEPVAQPFLHVSFPFCKVREK